MQGVSRLVITILVLVISIALVSIAYLFTTEQTEKILGETEWVLEQQRATGLSGLRIELFDIDNDVVTIKNVGKAVLSGFNLYVNDFVADITVVNSINPVQATDITINDISIDEGDVVKVTTAEGVYAIEVVPFTGDTCLDGTPYGECSILNKPYYCDLSGNFFEDCNRPCPCPVGTNTCLPFGNCTFISFVQLSGFWTFNQSSGTNIPDNSYESNDGTLGDGTCTEGTGSCPSWVAGLSGNALLFDGIDDYAGFGDNFDDLGNASSGSFLWWINFTDNTSAPGTQRFWGKHNNYEMRWVSGTPGVYFDVGQGNTLTAGISFENNRWYHLAFTWNATGTHFYVDGSIYATGIPLIATTDGGLPQSSDDFRIGEGGYNRGIDNNFAGIIDEFQIWNRTLSDTEIYNEYQKYAPSPPEPSSGLVGFWAFDGDTTDSSGNGNDGTNFGATWTSNAVSGQALTFDGGSDYVEIPFHESLQVEDGDFTVAGWVNGIDNQKAQNIYIVALYNDFGFRVAVGGNDNLGMWFRRADSSTGGYNTGNQVLDGTWHYIAVTKNGNTYTFYDNGQYVDDTTLSQALIVQSNVRRIGTWSPTYGSFNGTIDEVKIWNRSLSGTEINDEFNEYTPTSPLVGFWAFDENSGTSAADTSNYNNDGSLYGGGSVCSNPPTAGCPQWVSGINNSAIQFDGSNDYIRVVSDTSLDISDEITVAAWVKPNTATDYRRIVSKQYQIDRTTVNSCFQLGINTDNRWRWSIVTDVAYYNRLANVVYNPQIGQWYHFVGTYNGTHMIMYLDGQPIRTDTASGSIRVNSSEPFTIANSIFNDVRSFHFNGTIDEVKIWNRSLTSAEILNEYQQYTPPEPPPPSSNIVGFWAFDEGLGNTVSDSSGNGNTGTINAFGINLVRNPSFENDKQDWGSGQGTWDIVTAEFYHGSKSSRFQDLTGDFGHERTGDMIIPVTPGEQIYVSLYSRGSNIVQGEQGWYRALWVGRWLNSSMNVISGLYPDMTIGDGTGTWNWKRSGRIFTPPANAAYYRFSLGMRGNSTGTLWTDAVQVEYGNTITEFTDDSWTSSYNCVEGTCYGSNGTHDYVTVSDDISLDLTDAFTFSAWASPRTFGENGFGRIFHKGTTGGYIFYVRNSGSSEQFAVLINNTRYVSNTNIVQLNKWQHLAVTFNSSLSSNQVRFYLDGVPVGTGTRTLPTFGNGNTLYIGNRPGLDRTFNGLMDEIKVWNRSLSVTEIYDEYMKGNVYWGQPDEFSVSGNFLPAEVRCMGGQAANLPNMKIKSLNARFTGSGTASMGIYFGGIEGNPNGASLITGVYNQPVFEGWNTFYLPSEQDWPANTITWICLNTSGSANIYYNNTASFTTDFFTTHGRHNTGLAYFPATLGAISTSSYWYEFYLTYHQ